MCDLKAISQKFTLSRGAPGGGLKNLSGFFTGEGMLNSKKLGVLKIAEFGNFKIVNYIVKSNDF